MALAIAGAAFGRRSGLTHGRRRLLGNLVQACYFTVPTALFGGSPGQLMVGLQVVDIGSNQRPGWRQSALRWLVWAGPGIAARTLLDELSHRQTHPDGDEGGKMTFAASAAVIFLLLGYQMTFGRTARDHVSHTTLTRR